MQTIKDGFGAGVETLREYVEALEGYVDARTNVAPTGTIGFRPYLANYGSAYLENLKDIRQSVEPPDEPNVLDDLGYAVLNSEAPDELRRFHANRALDGAQDVFMDSIGEVEGIHLNGVANRAGKLSSQIMETVVDGATSYPDKIDVTKISGSLRELLYPEEQTSEDRAVLSLAMFDVVKPYLVDRILAIDAYDIDNLKKQVGRLSNDYKLLSRFFRASSDVSEILLTGNASATPREAADKLFDIGPMFAQLSQSFTKVASQAETGDEKSQSAAQYASEIGIAMQEGVAMPDEEQIRKLADGLPEGLELVEVFSSAKAAYVAKTRTVDGGILITKIKRTNIYQALDDNERMLQLVLGVGASYVQAHAGDSHTSRRLSVLQKSLPFGIAVTKADMLEELDFVREAENQERAYRIFADNPNIVVPKVIREAGFCDENHITMEYVPNQRIEDAPADINLIKNGLVMFLKGRKKKLIHGDMHGGNAKASLDSTGAIAGLDWGIVVETPGGSFEKNLVRFLAAIALKNPKMISRTYRRIQNPNNYQVTREEGEVIANKAIESAKAIYGPDGTKGKELGWTNRKVKEAGTILKNIFGMMGMDHQSTLDTRYTKYMRTSYSLKRLVDEELAKPEYRSRRKKVFTLLKAAKLATKEVYSKP